MFTKALIPLDLTPRSLALLERAETLKRIGVKRLCLLTIIEMDKMISTHYAHSNMIVFDSVLKSVKRRAQNRLSELKQEIEEEIGLEVETHLSTGSPGKNILKAAKQYGSDLIIIGARNESFFTRLLGSVTTRVINHTEKPVLVEQFHEEIGGDEDEYRLRIPNPFKHILYVTDFSEAAAAVEDFIVEVAAQTEKVTIFHVQELDRIKHASMSLEEFNAIDRERMEEIADRLKAEGIPEVETVIDTGHPQQLIPDQAEKLETTMITLAAKGRTNLSEVLLGCTAYNVVRRSMVPVLLWRQEASSTKSEGSQEKIAK